MKRWRELGEVPDSDDESFDDTEPHDQDDVDDVDDVDNVDESDELPRNDVDSTRAQEPHTQPAKDEDVWSVPSSAEQAAPSRAGIWGQASQILSEPPWPAQPTPKKDDVTDISTLPEPDTEKDADEPASTPRNSFPDDDISTGYVRATTPDSRASSPASFLSRTPTPPRSLFLSQARPSPPQARSSPPQARPSDRRNQEPLPDNEDEDEGEELLRQTAARLGRSLRPRKPIQQHPYLFENAQYTTFMKSHGVKPIRVNHQPQSTRTRPEEEDSQDQEFEAEESQEASGEGQGGLEESGPILFDDDEDELALTPSLPKTSPHGPHLRTSSQPTNSDQTDATNLSDEEFPPLERLQPVSAKKRQQTLKRQRSQLPSSTARKRLRFVPDSSPQSSPPRPRFIPPPPLNVWDLSSSPSGPAASEEPAQNIVTTPGSPGQRRPVTPDVFARRPTSTAVFPGNRAVDSPILINEEIQSGASDGDSIDSTEGSGSDSEVVRHNSRRIRGVLPASWLRLDQKTDKPAARGAMRKTPEPSPERVVRRGVALPRQRSPKPSSTAPWALFDESESENEPPGRITASEDPVHIAAAPIVIEEDDGASVVEEDTIDWMLPGRKRAGSHNTPFRAKKQKGSGIQSVFKGRLNQASRQPRITQVLSRSKQGITSTSSKRDSTTQRHQKGGGSSANRKKRASTPPRLSILDVVEPDAPRFVKIAARAVKRSVNLGKASPSKKVISLATRSDNVDALSVLRDWKSGKTKPKVAIPQPRRPAKPKSRSALREISTNPPSRQRGAVPQKLVRQSSLDSFVLAEDDKDSHAKQPPLTSNPHPRKPLHDDRLNLYPAQLEEDVDPHKQRQLGSRKRTLDALYRRSQRMPDARTGDGLDQDLDVSLNLLRDSVVQEQNSIADVDIDIETTPAATKARKRDALLRLRKKRRPQHVDLEAPQYARANDPLPTDFSVAEIQEHHPHDKSRAQDKLHGLGPYGTHYTHHFEVFPLDRGVFFHESTVIGRGLVRDALDAGLSDRIRHQRPAMSFSLDGQALRWAGWDDNTSSEFGILVDWVAEQLASSTRSDEGTGRKVIEAADFVLGYILRSLNVQGDLEERAFVSRCLEVFSNFTARSESVDWNTVPGSAQRTQLEVAVRFLLAIQAVRSLSQSSSGDPMQSMKLDDLLKKSASIAVKRLLECGTEELQILYGDLQRSTFRERGIRPDRFLANCWVVMMRLLESAAIPRSSFWDVTQSVMLGRGAALGSDAQAFERLWQDMFTLLPLSEIDDSGLLISGLRRIAPVEGWTLPQQLLKRAFQLYQANPRQPPGFNEYCRALVARCHFLVQQWGWRKCTGIIGTIFDFFGSQSLAHLRNEEVYKSPNFLEELDRKPSLSIDPEDRCFHIFIKLLALTIQRLKELGRVNDIKNLVARTLPNHNRQYLKEDTIHQHDLAALRNHHDLLCTLFWVSPPDLRPAVHLIEKLVVPGSAHKEACLINVRAWNQLARFVMSNGEGADAFRPLAAWRNNVFNQLLDQYLSAASDIEQQFRALANAMLGISKDTRDNMIARNKATALDVLHFSIKASLDVLQRAPTLGEVLYGLNTNQLQKVFTSLDYQSPGFDWSILRVALETVEHLIGRIDQASEEQYSSEFSDNLDAPYAEEAVMLVNEQLNKGFFWMSRTILALPLENSSRQHDPQVACVEKTVTLAARIAARFIKNGVMQLLPFFSPGRYSLFSDLPRNLNTSERRYLPLFLAVLVKNHVFNFKDLEINILGLWMFSIVKPLRLLGYENHLAEVLKQQSLPFLDRASVAVGIPPDYNSNVDFFACAIHHMRKTLRESRSAQSKEHRGEFSKTLQLVMQKMKDDLALLRLDASEHGLYIDFVRQVISLIKSHGVGICTVDDFFTQPSADYSPSAQDPKLHMAGIIAYGVKLSEKDVNAAPQLFHYLYTNFKIALGNDRLEQECQILGRAMRNTHVASFVLQFMIPAIIQASAQVPDCWALLEVYTVVLGDLLDGASVPQELRDDDMEHATAILTAILAWFANLKFATTLSLPQLHMITLLTTVANTLHPSITSYLFNNNEPGCDSALQDTVDKLATFLSALRSHIEDVLHPPAAAEAADEDGERSSPAPAPAAPITATASVSVAPLLSELPLVETRGGGGRNPRVQDFANAIVADVRRDWVVSGDRVMVRMAKGGKPAMSQVAMGGGSAASLRGMRYGPWEGRRVLEGLVGELGRLLGDDKGRVGGAGGVGGGAELFF